MQDIRYQLHYGKKFFKMPYFDLMRRFYEYVRANRCYFIYMLFVGFIRYFHLEKADDETIATYIQAWYGGFLESDGVITNIKANEESETSADTLSEKEELPASDFTNSDNNHEDNLFGAGGVFDLGSFKGTN